MLQARQNLRREHIKERVSVKMVAKKQEHYYQSDL